MSEDRSSPLSIEPRGFLAFPRGLVEWSVYRSLRPPGRQVVLTLLLRARFKPDEFWFGGDRIELQPGELIDAEETIAKHAGVSRKVVRTTIERLEKGSFLARRRAHPAGQCPHIITIKDYRLLLLDSDGEGQRKGLPEGNEGAKNGPTTGLEGAPCNKENPGNLGNPGNPGNTSPATSDSDCGEASRKKPARLTAELRAVLGGIEERCGRRFPLPSSKTNREERQRLIACLEEWIQVEGAENVPGQAEAFVRFKARQGYEVFGLGLFFEAADEVSRFSPGDRPDLENLNAGWTDILEPLSPVEVCEAFRESANIESLPSPDLEIARKSFHEKWKRRSAEKRRRAA